jgi:hypothetical protein
MHNSLLLPTLQLLALVVASSSFTVVPAKTVQRPAWASMSTVHMAVGESYLESLGDDKEEEEEAAVPKATSTPVPREKKKKNKKKSKDQNKSSEPKEEISTRQEEAPTDVPREKIKSKSSDKKSSEKVEDQKTKDDGKDKKKDKSEKKEKTENASYLESIGDEKEEEAFVPKEESTPPPPSSADQESPALPPPSSPDHKKKDESLLCNLGAITGRGEFATKAQKEAAVAVLKALEDANPTDQPAMSPKAMGRWELVYAETHSFRASPFFLAGRAVCQTAAEAQQFAWFCDMHRAALAVSQIQAVRQIVSADRLVSEFEVRAGAVPFLSDFTPFSYSGGAPVTITGAIVSSADASPTSDGNGWELLMDTVEIKGSNLPGVRQILDQGLKLQSRPLGNWLEENFAEQYSKPVPVLDITYLDDMFRISRDQDGNAYCYIKTSESTELTDYSRVDADLGVLRLLEGFNDAVTKFYI